MSTVEAIALLVTATATLLNGLAILSLIHTVRASNDECREGQNRLAKRIGRAVRERDA